MEETEKGKKEKGPYQEKFKVTPEKRYLDKLITINNVQAYDLAA